MNDSILIRAKKLSGVSVLSIALAACGGGGGSGGSDYSGSNPTATPTPAPTATPSPEANSVPLSKQVTNVGIAYTVAGSVNVLRPSEATEGEIPEIVDPEIISYKPNGLYAVAVDSADGDVFDLSFENLDGYSLYVFDNDPLGESACLSTLCMATWAPFIADDNALAVSPLSIISRDDGLNHWALRDKPLYLFSGDTAVGDTNGEGIGGVWHLAVNQPLQLNDLSVSVAEGDYFVAYGETLVSIVENEGSTDAFTSEVQNRDGFSLYTFDLDSVETSNCNGSCLSIWPALLAEENETATLPYSIIERQMDESGGLARQWAYQGKALYFFIGDSVAGDTAGTAVSNWRLARPQPWKPSSSDLGTVLAGAGRVLFAAPSGDTETISAASKDGFSLYSFDSDTLGVSNCSGGCLSTWPALMANEGAVAQAPYSIISRSAGGLQWALNGQPLYFYTGDAAAGDVNGDEVGDMWHLARMVPVVVDSHPQEGEIFVAHGKIIDINGDDDVTATDFTVYIFTNDNAGLPTCYGGCETTWPPLFAAADAQDFGDFTVVDRDDPSTTADDDLGIKQWAYQNQPLYFFSGDTSPGDVNGEYGTWFIARP